MSEEEEKLTTNLSKLNVLDNNTVNNMTKSLDEDAFSNLFSERLSMRRTPRSRRKAVPRKRFTVKTALKKLIERQKSRSTAQSTGGDEVQVDCVRSSAVHNDALEQRQRQYASSTRERPDAGCQLHLGVASRIVSKDRKSQKKGGSTTSRRNNSRKTS